MTPEKAAPQALMPPKAVINLRYSFSKALVTMKK